MNAWKNCKKHMNVLLNGRVIAMQDASTIEHLVITFDEVLKDEIGELRRGSILQFYVWMDGDIDGYDDNDSQHHDS